MSVSPCAVGRHDAVLVARTLDAAPPDVIVAQALSSQEETLAQPVQAQPPADYAIVIRHCNTIDEAQISLHRSALNIKYGPNGIGKSTISRALELNSQGGDALQELLPFRFRQGGGTTSPSVTGADDIERVLVFDDTYVSQFVFQADEVVKDSFEIFINTPEYREGIAADRVDLRAAEGSVCPELGARRRDRELHRTA